MKRRRNRHTFIFKVRTNNGEEQTLKAPAKVRHAKKTVRLRLTADHVRQAIALHGAGDTQKCAMAVCSIAHRASFPHPVVGYIDWFYSRAFVASKLNRKNGMPAECVEYVHYDDIGRLNDTPGGLSKLLAKIKKEGGRDIILRPIPKSQIEQKYTYTGHKGAYNGTKSSRGAKLRHAVAEIGGVG